MAQVQQRRALQAIVQELLSESCREKAQARFSPCECLPQEQRQKLEQQHPSPLPSVDKTKRSCSRSLPRSGSSRLPRPPGCGLMLRPFLLLFISLTLGKEQWLGEQRGGAAREGATEEEPHGVVPRACVSIALSRSS